MSGLPTHSWESREKALIDSGRKNLMSQIWLLLETSGKQGRVGIACDDHMVTQAALDPQRRHARDLSSTVARVLAEAAIPVRELSGVMISAGPGSFTGLRIGIISAKTLAYTLGCPLVAVPTFAILAEQAPAEARHLMVAADALKGMIYLQRFDRGESGWLARDELQIAPAQDWLPWVAGDTWLTGPGLFVHPTLIPCNARVVPECDREPQLAALYAVGKRISPLNQAEMFALEPIYLRGSSAEEKLKASAKN